MKQFNSKSLFIRLAMLYFLLMAIWLGSTLVLSVALDYEILSQCSSHPLDSMQIFLLSFLFFVCLLAFGVYASLVNQE